MEALKLAGLAVVSATWKPVAYMAAGYFASEFDLIMKVIGLF
jgi:hypothetical protein